MAEAPRRFQLLGSMEPFLPLFVDIFDAGFEIRMFLFLGFTCLLRELAQPKATDLWPGAPTTCSFRRGMVEESHPK